MKIKKILPILTLLLIAVFAQPSYAHSVIFETSPLQDNKLRITLKCSESNNVKGVLITHYYLKNGKTLTLGYEMKENAPKQSYIDFDLASALPPIRILLTNINDRDALPFKDVGESDAKEYIKHLHDAGIIKGRLDGSFDPYGLITRAEFVAILVKALNANDTTEDISNFKDIKGHWAEKYIKIAIKNKFLSGYGDGTIRPENNITVAEICSIIAKAFSFKTSNNGIYDKLKMDVWYSKAVKNMFDVGVLETSDGIYKNFNEESFINRENCTTILSRAICTY